MSLSFKDQLTKGIRNYPILYIPHFHRNYIINEVEDVCRQLELDKIRIIDCSEKDILVEPEEKEKEKASYDYNKQSIEKLAQYYRNIEQYGYDTGLAPTVCVVCEANKKLLEDSAFIALLYEHVQKYEQKCREGEEGFIKRTLILCVPSGELPPASISGICTVITITPPSENEISQELVQYGLKGCTKDIEAEYIRALLGLSLFDVRQILMSTKKECGDILNPKSVSWAYDEKQEIVRKTGVLEVVDKDVTLSDVGGLNNLKSAIESAARLYKKLPLLYEAHIPIPKGFLLLGMPGCGKSMIAKAAANEFGCPLLKLDMGKLLGKYVGDSEHNLQMALDVVDSAHPCVLWIDEIEKAFAGTNNVSGGGDSVMMRLMGKFLSWMQERKTAVFIMATANDVLKPELMRKGRFDEVFFVDFPTATEAKEIINKTLIKYSDLVNNDGPLRLFSENGSYILKIAKEMTTYTVCSECQKCDKLKECINNGVIDCSHFLSGAEISFLIDSYVSNSISELIKSTEDKGFVDLKNLPISEEDFENQLKKAKESAMINQRSLRCLKTSPKLGERKNNSFIDKIYEFRDNYKFRSASEQ